MSVSAPDSVRVSPRPALGWPIAWAVALLAGVFLAPFPVASMWPGGGYPSRAALVDSLTSGFVRYWDAGSGLIDPGLALPLDFWARFHVVKAVFAAVLLLVLVILGLRTWSAYTRAAIVRRRLLAGALLGVEIPLALLALLVLVANIQGAIAPFSSALGLLPVGKPDHALAETITQVRHSLASGASDPALETLVHDFTLYHVAMVGLGAVVTVALLAAAVLLWRRRAWMCVESRRGRLLLAAMVVAFVMSAAFFGVVTAVNLSTVARPAPALLGFFEGSW